MKTIIEKILDEEIARRGRIREEHRKQRITLREAARMFGPKMGMKPSEYLDWIYGHDICPHTYGSEKTIAGFHPPFIVIEKCKKCGYIKDSKKAEDCGDKELKEVFKSVKKIGRKSLSR